MTEEEYLAFADKQEFKHEYSGGQVIAMTDGTVCHGTITANTSTHINIQLSERDCSATSPDVRVHIAYKKAYRYPDVTVYCGDPVFREGRTDTLTNPVLLVEVLSSGTAHIDLDDKLAEYTHIESLQAYIIVFQDKPHVQVYQHHDGEQWLYTYAIGVDAEIDVTLFGDVMRLSLAAIYRRVRWEDVEVETPSDDDS